MKNKIIIILLVFSITLISACSSELQEEVDIEENIIETIVLNVCELDPENEDYWLFNNVNLFDKPGGISKGAVIVGDVQACANVHLDVMDKAFVDNTEFYKVKLEDMVGWQTKRLLVGE